MSRWPGGAASVCQGSGRRVVSPQPAPLRTGLAPCDASGSSLLKRLSRDAVVFCPHLAIVSLSVAVGVEQFQIVQAIVATLRAPHPVVQVPFLFLLQGLAA